MCVQPYVHEQRSSQHGGGVRLPVANFTFSRSRAPSSTACDMRRSSCSRLSKNSVALHALATQDRVLKRGSSHAIRIPAYAHAETHGLHRPKNGRRGLYAPKKKWACGAAYMGQKPGVRRGLRGPKMGVEGEAAQPSGKPEGGCSPFAGAFWFAHLFLP